MLVDGEVVVHVELHLRDDAAEIGNEAAEHARLVHPAQHLLGIVAAGQQLEEQRVGALVAAHLAVDQPRVARDQPQRLRVDLEVLGIGER